MDSSDPAIRIFYTQILGFLLQHSIIYIYIYMTAYPMQFILFTCYIGVLYTTCLLLSRFSQGWRQRFNSCGVLRRVLTEIFGQLRQANINNWTFDAANMPEDSNPRIVCIIILAEVTLLVVQQSRSG